MTTQSDIGSKSIYYTSLFRQAAARENNKAKNKQTN